MAGDTFFHPQGKQGLTNSRTQRDRLAIVHSRRCGRKSSSYTPRTMRGDSPHSFGIRVVRIAIANQKSAQWRLLAFTTMCLSWGNPDRERSVRWLRFDLAL
jgi:hypothetical protein